MSEENLVALKQLYAHWAAGDWTDTSIFDPQIVGVMPDPRPHAYHGAQALAEYTRSFLDAWRVVRVEATEYREVENSFLVWVQLAATGSASGVELEDRLIHVWTFRGTKAIRFDVFDDESDALAAVGVSG
jgi:ketosteroid isomerase-like protein